MTTLNNTTTIELSDISAAIKEFEEAKIIGAIESREENRIYITDFKNKTGKFINMYIKDMKVSPTIQITLSYIYAKEEVMGIELTKVNKGKIDSSIKFSLKEYSKFIQILEFLKSIDYPTIQNQAVTFANEPNLSLDDDTKRKLHTLFADEKNQEFLPEILNKVDLVKAFQNLFNDEQNTQNLIDILNSGAVQSRDIVNVGYRREQLSIFETMLSENISEKEWQKFFERNEWIFGYGLDYKFNKILQREYSTGSQSINAKGDSRGDFLLTDDDFTVLVELKTPCTALFEQSQYRSGCWCVSGNLSDATSQILSQKYELSLNFDELTKDLDGNIKLYDPKTILIIGDWKQIKSDDKITQRIKQRTFELYRRNLRNVDILTFDELFKRAKHILEHDNI